MSGNFFIVLEDAVGLVAVEEYEGFAVFGTGNSTGALEAPIVCKAAVVTKLDERVLQVGRVSAKTEVDVPHLELIGCFHFYAGIVHDTHIAHGTGLTYISIDRGFHEHAVGALIIPVQREGNRVFEEAEVDTDVCLDRFLPAKGRIGKAA